MCCCCVLLCVVQAISAQTRVLFISHRVRLRLCLFVQIDGSKGMDQDRGPRGVDANYPRATPSICQVATTEGGSAIHQPLPKNGNDVKSPLEKPAVPRKEPVPPDVAAAAARKRVEKLEAVLVTLGEDDDIFPVIREALTKARAQATSSASVRTHPSLQVVYWRENAQRVEVARPTIVKARVSLAEAVAAQEKQEALMADGEQRLSQLLLEEENNLSPFTVPPPPVDASAELSRVQDVINDLQRESARLRPVQPVEPTISDDRVNGVGPRSLISIRVRCQS